MAFEKRGGLKNTAQYLTELQIGDVLEGYVRGFPVSKHGANISLKLTQDYGEFTTGQEILIFPAGNVRYMLIENEVVAGQLTRITRVADKNVKGKNSSQFAVEQDPSQTMEVDAEIAAMNALAETTSTTDGVKGAVNKFSSKSDQKRTALLDKARILNQSSSES